MKDNKLPLFIVFGGLAAVFIIGSVVLHIVRPEATGSLLTMGTTILGLVTGFAGILYNQNKQGEAIEAVKKQTNGTLTARDEKISELTDENISLREEVAALKTRLGEDVYTGTIRVTGVDPEDGEG